MRSSISNSDVHLTRRWVPGGAWLWPLLVALTVCIVAIGLLEKRLAWRGFEPTIIDSPALWAGERARIDRLGNRALVLVGASRMQLDIDLDTLRVLTGKDPVQLAIDGSSFVPVLADLAADDKVTGTVLVDYQDHVVNDLDRHDGATVYVAEWERDRSQHGVPGFASSETYLKGLLHRYMRSFADGASPFDSLTRRAWDSKATPQYLTTRSDRERMADYTRVHMPDFYLDRAMRNAGIEQAPRAADGKISEALLAQKIATLPVATMPRFAENSRIVAGMVQRIEARGGRVIFMVFPRSGLVRLADDRRFPRQTYWQSFIDTVRTPSLHYADVPSMRALVCPDGSHLDLRDRVAFTRDLVHAMPLLSGGSADVVPRTAGEASPSPGPEHAP